MLLVVLHSHLYMLNQSYENFDIGIIDQIKHLIILIHINFNRHIAKTSLKKITYFFMPRGYMPI